MFGGLQNPAAMHYDKSIISVPDYFQLNMMGQGTQAKSLPHMQSSGLLGDGISYLGGMGGIGSIGGMQD